MFSTSIKRRTFGGLLLSACAMALGARDKRDTMEPFHWARIKFNNLKATEDKWDAVPEADIILLKELKKRTGLNIDTTRYTVSLDNLDEVCQFPFLFMTSDGALELPPNQANNLLEYLKRGGFLFADDCVANGAGRVDAFYLDLKAKIEHLFGRPMVPLPNGHEIYHSFYDLDGLPYIQGVEHKGQAVFIDGRMAVFLSSTDMHCGWYDYYIKHGYINSGWYPGIDSEKAIKMGVNIMMYVMSH